MNGIKLPDPINPSYDSLIDKTKTLIPKGNNSREVKFEALRNTSPRYASNYDNKDESVSTLRLNNHVPQTHALGRNVYRSNDPIRTNTTQNRSVVNNPGRIDLTNRLFNQNPECRKITESLYSDLNNTFGSNYTERISSIDSFEDKYYRSNDPDQVVDLKHNDRYNSRVQHQATTHVDDYDKDRLINYAFLQKTRKQPDKTVNDISRNKIYNEMAYNDIISKPLKNRSSNGVSSLNSPNNKTDYNNSVIGNVPNFNTENSFRNNAKTIHNDKTEVNGSDTQYCQLTKDELFNGLGSIGLALSKVFSLTGKGVLYLCSSITDNTEGLFDSDKKTNDQKGNHLTRDNYNQNCNCGLTNTNKDYKPIPDLHINYETCCMCNDERHNCSNEKKTGVYFKGRKLEPNRNYMDNNFRDHDILVDTEREYINGYKQGRHYTNMNHIKPSELHGNYINHPEYNKKNDYYNFKLDYESYPDFRNNNFISKNEDKYYPYENNTNRNLCRDRDILIGYKTFEKDERNEFIRDYPFDESFNRSRHDIKNEETSTHLSNPNKCENVSTHPYNSEMKPNVNINNRRTMEFNRDNSNSNGLDKNKVAELAEKTRKNTVEVPSFSKPSISAYGTKTNEYSKETNGTQTGMRAMINMVQNTIISKANESVCANNANDKIANKISEKPSSKMSNDENAVKKTRSETREQMSLKGDLIKTLKDQNTKEVEDKGSIGDVNSSNIDKILLSDYSRNKSVDRISIGDDNSNKSVDRISIGENDSNKSVDIISTSENDSKDGSKKKSKRRVFSFAKKSKERS